MKISRQVGTINELVPIFVQDATVSTGAGFPNLLISSFSTYYHRSDMTSTSSVTLVSTGTLGTWSSGQWLQINSSFMRGWYQLCLPNGVFAAGSTCALHLYGHPSMAPLPVEIEITRFNNQGYVSSQPHNVERLYSSALVTSLAGIVNVARVGVSSFGLAVGVSSFDVRVGVSSFGIGVGVSSMNIGVDVSSFYGSAAVTTAAGVLGVGRVGVSSFGLAVGVSSQNVPVDVSSFYGSGLITSAAGVIAGHTTSMRAVVDAQIVDRLLARNIAGGSDTGRIVTEALYFLRNRSAIVAGELTVYQTDDTTSSWTATISTASGNPIVSVDPA